MPRLHCTVTVLALAALVALGLAPLSPVHGQTSNATASAVVAQAPQPESAEPFPTGTITLILVAITTALTACSAYHLMQDRRHRLLPVLSWSPFGDGSKFMTFSHIGGGGTKLTIQMANVGKAAAMDIECTKGATVTKYGVTPRIPGLDTVSLGSLPPNALTTIPIVLSSEEYQKICEGARATLIIRFKYKTPDNKTFFYPIIGTYSRTAQSIYGPVNKNYSSRESLLDTNPNEYLLEAFEQTIEEYPENAMAHLDRAAALHSLGRDDEAFESIDRAVKLDPGVRPHIVKDGILIDLGRFNEALPSLDRTIKINHKDSDAHCLRGRALFGMGRHDEAFKSFELANARDFDGYSYVVKARALFDLGRHSEALESLEQSIRFDAMDAEAYCLKGRVLAALAEQDPDSASDYHEGAIAALEEALAIDPDYAESQRELERIKGMVRQKPSKTDS